MLEDGELDTEKRPREMEPDLRDLAWDPGPDTGCWPRREASRGTSVPVRDQGGGVPGCESTAELGEPEERASDGPNLLGRLDGSFMEPKTEAGGRKMEVGRWGW